MWRLKAIAIGARHMSVEFDKWLGGIGVNVPDILQNVESDGIGSGVLRAGGAAFRVFQAASQGVAVAATVGSGAAVAVGVAGLAVGVVAPIAVGYLLEHGEELQQQPDPDEKSLPGGAPPPASGPDGGAPISDQGAAVAPPPTNQGDAGAE